jgi:hypothetical protein
MAFSAHGLKGDPSAKSQRRFYCNIVKRYVEVGTRESVPIDVTGPHRRLPAKDVINLLPIDLLGAGRRCRSDEAQSEQHGR